MRDFVVVPALLVALFLGSCQRAGDSTGPELRPLAFVSLLPQVELLSRIAGDRWEVLALVPPGQPPDSYDATPRQVARLGEARLFVRIGAPFENGLLAKIRSANPSLVVVDQRERVKLIDPDGHGHVGHDHSEHADHHVWIDPKGLQLQAGSLREALSAADPEGRETYSANFAALMEDLKALDARITAKLHPFRGRTLFVHHPAYAYFAQSYGLHQISVEEHGREPSARRLTELTEAARSQGWRTLFVQREFSDRNARILAESVGAEVVVLDPLAPDLLANLERMADTIAARLAREE